MLELERFIKKYKLSKYKMNPHFPLNTLLPMRAAVAAETEGQLPEFITALEIMTWEEGLKSDDPEVLVKGLTEHGLDGAKLVEMTQDPGIKAKLIEYTNEAVERGIFGVPTFFYGDAMFFGKDRLLDLEEEITGKIIA